MQGEIERSHWKDFLDGFSKRNRLRAARLEIIGEEVGAQQEADLLPFVGVSLETKGDAAGRVEIILGGETAADPRHLTHAVDGAERIVPLVGASGFEDGLEVEDKEGVKTLLRFESLPEVPGGSSGD